MHLESFSGVRCLATLGRCGRRSWQLLLHPVAGECAICEWRYLLVPEETNNANASGCPSPVVNRIRPYPSCRACSSTLRGSARPIPMPRADRGERVSGGLADSLLGCLHTAATNGVSVEVHDDKPRPAGRREACSETLSAPGMPPRMTGRAMSAKNASCSASDTSADGFSTTISMRPEKTPQSNE